MKKTALICGVSGQDGAYLSKLLLKKGYNVVGTSRDATTQRFEKLAYLNIEREVELLSMVHTDFRSVVQTLKATKPDEIYNLAGQSSVGLSFHQPVETLESIAVGTINLLEAMRFVELTAKFYNAGSGECFGDTGGLAATEDTAFRPRSPYATAKAAAHWTVANYREAYGIEACTGILFNHESPLRPQRFVTRKIVRGAIQIATSGDGILELGNLDISRDWGWAPEYVEAMWRMLQLDKVEDFVIATGTSSTLSSFCDLVFDAVGLAAADHVRTSEEFSRPSDIDFSLGDPSKAFSKLQWKSRRTLEEIAVEMVRAEQANG